MTEKHPPPSTQTTLPTQSLPPLNPLSPTPTPKSFTPSASFPVISAIPAPSVPAVASIPPAHDAPFPKVESAAEEEPYTIKCICGYTGDDGNTIYCETCDSWQHIECFYPNNSEEATREEFSHSCHDCKPRHLDVAHAIEYQKYRLQAASAEAVTNQKPKRPPTKPHAQSHKKKAKPGELQINGHSSSISDVQRHTLSGQDGIANHHPQSLKKAKSSHKSSHSVGGSHSKRSPSYSASRTTLQPGHPLSPATTPPDLLDGSEGYNYSSDFLNLCNDQDAAQNVQTNSFASLAVSNTTSIWLREPERMLRETGHKFANVFQALPANIEAIRRPPRVDAKKRILGQDTVVRWRYLASSAAVDKDVPLMELNGQVGFQNDYCAVPANRYEELSCPLPFVFFHPLLPLYIDTRREGSFARYARRSCRPNTVLDTYLADGSEYQFWLVSDRHIAADEQITLPWDFRLPNEQKGRMLWLLGLSDDDAGAYDELEVEEEEYSSIARWVSLVLSRYGGCACDLGPDCAFARFHRTYGAKLQHAKSGASKKKPSRKTKPHTLSPSSTGHATNSRAASEGHPDDFPEADKMSTSSRSKPPSRDMTPAPRQGSFDTLGILTEPTDRDKRKVAMVEDSFRRLEQQPPRKKKRTSDGTTSTEKSSVSGKSKTKSSSSTLAGRSGGASEHSDGGNGRHYVDASTLRSNTDSPNGAVSPSTPVGFNSHGFSSLAAASGSTYSVSRQTSVGPSPGYRDASVQTDPTEGEWYSGKSNTPRPRRRIVSLSRRLLNCRHRPHVEDTPSPAMPPCPSPSNVNPLGIVSPEGIQTATPKLPSTSTSVDVTMTNVPSDDAAAATASSHAKDTPSTEISTTTEPAIKGEPMDDEMTDAATVIKKSPDLRVQLPKAPSFSDAVLPTGGSATTPLSTSSIVQSPFALSNANPFGSLVATPSPIKKKMSLSDYTKSRKAAAGRPSIGTILKPVPNSEEPKSATSTDGISESPTVTEKPTSSGPATAASELAGPPN